MSNLSMNACEEDSCTSVHLDMSCAALLSAPNISKLLPVALQLGYNGVFVRVA